METVGNYWLFWSLYVTAATLFFIIFWKLTKFEKAIWISYSLRAVAATVIFTPWYSNPQDSLMAPALMVVTLDAITLGADAIFRSVVPLLLALLFALFLAGTMSAIKKKRKSISIKNKKDRWLS